ncbi:transcriptional regulator [Pelagicoccus sp. SDUM812005]|uniref:helix-turn-helix transcriptional regulator n=1 Tax=Pelagicoccus sp. SDUM812005 TaxID=3041257 RepID=UPI00280DC2EA|nr:transcriptional regulator [Pelagicoccus sp. SDUM812005]MDQ8183378.1 transcriptional regulator [Pelagicoccus sp. SDUM812005]
MPLKNGSYKGATWATRRALLDMLKLGGELSSAQMAAELGVSSMAIRQHMQELEAAGDVQSEDRAQGKGRPTKFWSLAPAAARHFPDRHRDLILDLLGNVQAVLGEDAMDRLLDERGKEQARQYGRRVAGCSTLGERVRELAKLRSEEGYMAEASEGESGVFTLVENHCPICAAAAACQDLCARELTVFERVLGPDCSVERVEHMLSGARRCAYEIRPSKAGK